MVARPAAVMMVVLLGATPALAQRAAQAGAREATPELVLQLDFVEVDGPSVHDASGHGFDATLDRAEVVVARKKTVVKLDGRGSVRLTANAPRIEAEGKSLTVGAMVNPAEGDGVIASVGDATDGFSLYLRGAVPHFAVRSGGTLHTVAGSEPIDMDTWSHVAGVIGPNGDLTLVVNTMPDGTAPGALLGRAPSESLSIGADPGVAVGDYAGPMRFRGMLGDVRLYWGEVGRNHSAALLGDWADRPMCGMSR